MSGVAESELVERASAVERIRDAIDSASAGEGRLVLIEGEAGVGKTTLLALAAGVAADAGVRVCSARGTEFEGDLPNGVVRQLFASFAQDSDPERRASCFAGAAGLAEGVLSGAGEVIGDAFAIRHAMYWLLANIAADGPVLISVDDVQWADLMSVRWLGYLSERLEGLPVVVVASVRVGGNRRSWRPCGPLRRRSGSRWSRCRRRRRLNWCAAGSRTQPTSSCLRCISTPPATLS